jgi:hypothetical protein
MDREKERRKEGL